MTAVAVNPFLHAANIFLPEGAWQPWPKQALATELAQTADELLFGGAAGPGKTEWLCEYSISQMEDYPGNRGLVLRRVFPSLSRTIIPRLKMKLRGRARWNANEKTFTFPNESILEVGSVQYADDVIDYQGAEYGLIAFEEITEFMLEQYEFLQSRVRAPQDGIRAHTISTTNPGGPGHGWVKRRFIKMDVKAEDFPGQQPAPYIPWQPRPTQEKPNPPTRVFVPATHEDNPTLLRRDPGYLDRLRQISRRGLRLALEKGDWDAIDQIEGALWSAEDLDRGRVSPQWFGKKVRSYIRALAVDPSDGEEETSDAFGVSLCARGMDGVGYVEGSWGWRSSPRKMAEAAIELYYDYGCSALVIEKNHGGKWMLDTFRAIDPTVNIVVVWASDKKRTRAEPVAALFERNRHQGMDEQGAEYLPYLARLVGFFPQLEEELVTTTFKPGDKSPNELDAMVWNLSYLMLGVGQATRSDGRDQRLRGRR